MPRVMQTKPADQCTESDVSPHWVPHTSKFASKYAKLRKWQDYEDIQIFFTLSF